MTDDPYAIMQSYAKPTAKSRAGLTIIDDHLANRAAEQERAVRLTKKFLKEDDVTQVVAASGFGKTWVAHKLIADASRSNAQHISVVVEPGILLVDQAKKRFAEYLGDRAAWFDLVAVCSDAEAKTPWGEFNHLNITEFRALLKKGAHRRTIIITTNASAAKVGEVLKKLGAADLLIVDEAHHAAGSADKPMVKAIHGILAEKVIYMTATQKMVASRVSNRRSMDDPAYFGDVAYSLTFGEAAMERIIAPSVLAFLSVTENSTVSMLDNLGEDGFRVGGKQKIKAFKYEVAAAIAIVRCLTDGGLKRILTFHNHKAAAERFSSLLASVAELMGCADLWFGNVTENTRHRQDVMDDFTTLGDGQFTGAALSSCRVLAEGYDLPLVDGVAIVDPRMSPIDVTQTINRGSRFDDKRPGKKNVVIIPVLGDGRDSHSAAFAAIRAVLELMREMDTAITGTMYDMAGFQRPQSLDESIRATPSVITDLPEDVARTISLKVIDWAITSWENRFEELKTLNRIPNQHVESDKSLADWVKTQRMHYRRDDHRLTPERIARLEALPFWVWTDPGEKSRIVMDAYSPNKSLVEIATDCGLDARVVRNIIYRHNLPYVKTPTRGQSHPGAILTESQVRKLMKLRRQGKSYGQLSAIFGVGMSAIQGICNGTHWVHITGGPILKES